MNALGDAVALAAAGLRIELRTRAAVAAAVTLGGAVLFLMALAIGPDPARLGALAPSVVWIALAFAAVGISDRLDALDRVDDPFAGLWLAAQDRRALYLGKLLALGTLLVGIQGVLWALAVVLFEVPLGLGLVTLVPVAVAVALAAGAVCVLAQALVGTTAHRALLLPVVVLPLLLPTLLTASGASEALLIGRPADALGPLGLLAVQAALYLGLGLLVYEAAAAPE
ncbi:MAG TPA: heme exporter protein CcmB [Candidatus Saccharimonadales bacterium]|nr:heme exporter protein CcmB [Candidatus Saccharimonadales bacterium]